VRGERTMRILSDSRREIDKFIKTGSSRR